jgi:hypothetical protein
MTVGRQPVEVRLTPAQTLRMERMGGALWPTEKLSAAEVTRRLALTQLSAGADGPRNHMKMSQSGGIIHDGSERRD